MTEIAQLCRLENQLECAQLIDPTASSLNRLWAWHLYLIECRNRSIYTGIARDVPRRLRQHLLGKGARFTRMHPPRSLLAVYGFADRSTASTAEHLVKQLSVQEKRALCTSAGPPVDIRQEYAGPDPDRSCPDP